MIDIVLRSRSGNKFFDIMDGLHRSTKLKPLTKLLVLALAVNICMPAAAQPLSSSLIQKLPQQWEAQFQPPSGRGNPEGREGGGTRGDTSSCIPANKHLIALMPPSGFGNTISNHPTIFWYLPPTTAQGMEFILLNKNDQEVYTTELAITGNPGIKSLQLSTLANLQPLEINQEYHWNLILICNLTDRSADIQITGSLRRVNSDKIVPRLSQAVSKDNLLVYAENGLWYDTLTTLIQLRHLEPEDTVLWNAWTKLLNSAGLESIIKEPLINKLSAESNIQSPTQN